MEIFLCGYKKIHFHSTENVQQYVPENLFDKIRPSGSQPGKIYGLCKVHKVGNPLRPVVSMIGTAEYGLAKYLDDIIKPCIPGQFMLNSTLSFIQNIRNFVFKPDYSLVSYDVVSLFTNIPLKETLEIVCDYVYKSSNHPAFSKTTFKKLLEFATGGYFLYKGKIYCQIDGVTMGSPLGPTLANFFLAHYEKKFMSENLESKPLLYLRYVDDIFCVFKDKENIQKFLNFLNNIHPNLKFTFEVGEEFLPFLDTKIELPNNINENINCKIYRKPTNTDVIINYNAFCPSKWKTGVMLCFLNRAYNVCNSWNLFDEEVNNLLSIFSKNGYPKSFFDNCVKNFLDKKFCEVDAISEPESDVITMCIPYFGNQSLLYKKQMTNCFKKIGCNLRVVFKSFRVRNYFSLKDVTPLNLKAKFIYHFTGSCDESTSYIGKTKRHFAVRFYEHQNTKTAVNQHSQKCLSCSNFTENNFKIIGFGKNDFDLRIKEALFIKYRRPSINNQLKNKGSEFYLKIF